MNDQFLQKIASHNKALKSFALSFTNDADDADDLVQETMVKAVRYAHRFEEGTNLQGWLFTILRNTFINDYRKNIRKNAVISQEEDLSSSQLRISAQTNGATGKMAMDDIQKALDALPEKPRYAFVRYFEGYKYEEIAQELDMPVGTIKTHIHTARKLLKQSLSMYKDKHTA